MTMLAAVTNKNGLMTLADYEARIHLYKEQIGVGYIGIGRTLIEAKEAEAKFFMTISKTGYSYHRIFPLSIPVAVALACCATPSPKFRVEKAVSPSGIIHAARSGTRFRHFRATMLAAIM